MDTFFFFFFSPPSFLTGYIINTLAGYRYTGLHRPVREDGQQLLLVESLSHSVETVQQRGP